mmetsp:Transcript_80297/g.160266  ORF Transcript_80297/g.160266 Transcript_80297/m.160266 type:complete len:222 (+) Transcript_80297:34-699(+)
MLRTIIALCLVGPAVAFSPLACNRWARGVTASVTIDEAYTTAESATKEFGIASKEARLAWETVDDMENMGGAVKANTVASSPISDTDLSKESAVRQIEGTMATLEELTNAAKTVNTQMKYEILKLQNLKLGSGVQAAAGALSSPAYKAAKSEAEAAASKFGADSSEAKVAWAAVYEIVSASDDKTDMGSLEDECLLNSSSKCVEYQAAMDELNAAISGVGM